MNDAIEVILVDYAPLMVVHQLQHKLVKEDPLVAEEFVEEDVHVVDGDDRWEQAEDPLRGEEFGFDPEWLEMVENAGEVLLHQNINHLRVLKEAWQWRKINVSQLVVLNQGNKQPKGNDFRAVEQQRGDDVVHSLHIVDLAIVVWKCCQHSP